MRRNLYGGANIGIAEGNIQWGNNKISVVYDKINSYCFTKPRVEKLFIVKGYGLKCEKFIFVAILSFEVVHRRSCHTNLLFWKIRKINCVKGIKNSNFKNRNKLCKTYVVTESNRTLFKRGYLYKRVSKKACDRLYAVYRLMGFNSD